MSISHIFDPVPAGSGTHPAGHVCAFAPPSSSFPRCPDEPLSHCWFSLDGTRYTLKKGI